jgi:phosphatidate cytidylyltransferase
MISSNFKKRFFTSIFLILLVFLIFSFNPILIYFLIVLGILSIIEFQQMTRKLKLKTINFYLINIFFIFYIFTFCVLFFFFSNLEGSKILLFILLCVCIASDLGGYIFGKIFKGPKLTKISPNKTVSGSIGSIIFSLLLVSFLSYYFIGNMNLTLNMNRDALMVALITSVFCQIGDLAISFLKRKAKLHDTGKILPGHGGILDRIDGILLGVPFGLLSFIILS